MNFSFITIAGKIGNVDVGFGHLNRSIVIAKELIKRGHDASFLYSGDRNAGLILEENNLEFNQIDFENLESNPNKLQALNRKSKIFFIDLSHPIFLKESKQIDSVISILKEENNRFILIDSPEEQSILKKLQKEQIDLLVIPYYVNDDFDYQIDSKLVGARYVMLGQEYKRIKEKKITNRANNFLISCGGSDPFNLSLLSLRALGEIEECLNIKLVIGPLFSKELKDSIEEAALSLSHNLEIIRSPKSLAGYIEWSDITISTSGLTKYEIMVTGTPSVIILSKS